jgi:hypothetical protein
MEAIKKLDRCLQVTEDLLFGRELDLRVTGVKREEVVEYGSLMPSPHVLAQLILATGHAPKGHVKNISMVEIKAQNTAGENFRGVYRLADPEFAAGFANTMRGYEKSGEIIHVNIHNLRNRLPWYLPLMI